jgi:hypothetical protein
MKRTLVAAGHRFGLFVAFLALTMLTALTARPASAVTFITASGPFVLNKPHETYYLATNLKFEGNGLEITADGVDLELAGKTISGTPSILDGPPPETVGILVSRPMQPFGHRSLRRERECRQGQLHQRLLQGRHRAPARSREQHRDGQYQHPQR